MFKTFVKSTAAEAAARVVSSVETPTMATPGMTKANTRAFPFDMTKVVKAVVVAMAAVVFQGMQARMGAHTIQDTCLATVAAPTPIAMIAELPNKQLVMPQSRYEHLLAQCGLIQERKSIFQEKLGEKGISRKIPD